MTRNNYINGARCALALALATVAFSGCGPNTPPAGPPATENPQVRQQYSGGMSETMRRQMQQRQGGAPTGGAPMGNTPMGGAPTGGNSP